MVTKSENQDNQRRRALLTGVHIDGVMRYAKNSSNTGTNRDMVTDYTYAWTGGAETVTSTTGGRSQVSHYNVLGQLDWEEDECSRHTGYQYDWRGRLTITTLPAVGGVQKTIENSYDCCHLEWTRDEENHKTYYSYDGMGRVERMWTDVQVNQGQKEGDLVSYTYTAPFGAVDTVTTYIKNGSTVTPRTTTYTYDSQGRVERVQYPAGDADQGPVYDERYQYDDLGRLVAKLVGLLDGSQRVLDGGKVTAYAYNDLNRVEKVSYDYYAGKQLPERPWPLVGITIPSPDVSYVYDGATSRVSTVSMKKEMLGETSGDAYRDAGYTYDSLGRIKTYTPAVPSGYGAIEYTWNTLGEKTSMKVPLEVPLGVNNLARLVEYLYDNTGRQFGMNVKSDIAASSTGAPDPDSGATTRFAYDANQNRVRLTTKAGSVYQFVYDPTASIPAVVYEQGPTYRYVNVREPDAALVSRERWNDQGVEDGAYTYHFDGLGSTRAITDESGVVTDTYDYDEWGNVTHTSGSTADNPYLYVGQYGYYSHYQEPSMDPLDVTVGRKLLQLGVRYYGPAVGRFTQRDALPTSYAAYVYADDAPDDLIDPTGYYCFVGQITYSGRDTIWDDTIDKQISSKPLTRKPYRINTCGHCHGPWLGRCWGMTKLYGESSIDSAGHRFPAKYVVLDLSIKCIAAAGVSIDLVKLMYGNLAALAGKIPGIGGFISNIITNVHVGQATTVNVPMPPRIKGHATRNISTRSVNWTFSIFK